MVAGAALEALLAVRECQLETRTISIMERIEEVIECKGHGHGQTGAETGAGTRTCRRSVGGSNKKNAAERKNTQGNSNKSNNNKRHLTF